MTHGAQRLPFPEVVPVDPSTGDKAVWVSLDDTLYVPDGVASSFDKVNAAYKGGKRERLRFMADSVFQYTVPGTFGANVKIDASFVHDPRNENSDELLVITSPLNDGPPKTEAGRIYEYAQIDDPTKKEVALAQPNSWSPATKLDIGYEFLNVEGINMPVLQIFSRVPPRALSVRERAKIIAGADFDGFGRVALEGVRRVDLCLREFYGMQGVKKVHLFGAGTTHNTAAAAKHFQTQQDQFELGSLTAMNPILGERLQDMLPDYSVRQHEGEAAKIIIPPGYRRINEPFIRQDIDGKGTEKAMRLRQIRAMLDISYMQGIARSGHTQRVVEDLVGSGVPVTVALGYNGSMTAGTRERLPVGESNLHLTDIVGVEGKKVGMMSNEHAALVALIMGIGYKNADRAAA